MLDQEIREHIRSYLAGSITAAALEAWVAEQTLALDEEPTNVRDLANDAMRFLAEAGNGDWTEDELRAHLGRLSRTYWFEQTPKATLPGSGDVSHRYQLEAAADRSHVGESA
jgi:hypothetical protein